jgi:hypothetical protein
MFGFMKRRTNKEILDSIRPQFITQDDLTFMINSKKLESIVIEDDLKDNEHLYNPETDEIIYKPENEEKH